MNTMWVVPFKGRDVVSQCVRSIGTHHEKPRVWLVNGEFNKKYGPGAFKLAYDTFPKVDFFYLIFDSLTVNANLDHLTEQPLTTVRWFDSDHTGWGWNENTGEPLDDWALARGVGIPDHFNGVMGPMLMASREVIERADLFRILPTNRYEQCALERCWGIWLQEAGYDVTASSLQGQMHGFFDKYDETYVTKRSLSRA